MSLGEKPGVKVWANLDKNFAKKIYFKILLKGFTP